MADCQSAFVIVAGSPYTVASHPVLAVTAVVIEGHLRDDFDGPYICEKPYGHSGPCGKLTRQ